MLFAVPFRHHMKHPHSFYTIGDAYLDYTKAVIITDPLFLSDDKPTIDSSEFAVIKKMNKKYTMDLQNMSINIKGQ